MASQKTPAQILAGWNARVHSATDFQILCDENACIHSKMVQYYKEFYTHAIVRQAPIKKLTGIKSAIDSIGVAYTNMTYANRVKNMETFDATNLNISRGAAGRVWAHYGDEFIRANIFAPCAGITSAANGRVNQLTKNAGFEMDLSAPQSDPFDRRLDRLEQSVRKGGDVERFVPIVPYKSKFAEISTSSYLISKQSIDQIGDATLKGKVLEKVKKDYEKMAKDEFYKGVPSLQNYYALTRLYGSNGGAYLVNERGKRRWYEVDTDEKNLYNYASTPTTSALISWGRGDPYGRTPYQFTDFVFSKYWNKIQNNRLITLRRYAAPMLDNLKFPGMLSIKTDETTLKDISEQGTSKDDSVAFPPMASAITYFGGETGNSLTNLLKFTTGLPWADLKADVWEVNTDSVPNNTSGIGSIFGGAAKLGEILSVAGGQSDLQMVQNDGALPPDPYKDGPYENRIMGPINRIDSVKRRAPGLTFEWSGLNLVFEYVARPVGGINPKAVLLDILSNFLVIGSASAVFFGGAHRFMAAPAKYPFMGGAKGQEQWYKGDPIGWGTTVVNQFTGQGAGSALAIWGDLGKAFMNILSQGLSGAAGDLFASIASTQSGTSTDNNPLTNLTKNYMAKKTAGQVPYLQGMKAILTGEPVGEWHVTIGNPLNPIAMIGNLICEGITVEFNEELGPDDFPTEMKITVKLNHGMARDRDAIESMFNRGMGRIYMLPDYMAGSADYQTTVDQATKEKVKYGTAPGRRSGTPIYSPGQDSGYISKKEAQGKPDPMEGDLSVWSRASFSLGISENSAQQFISSENDIFQSAYRTADWVAKRSI